MQQTVPSIDDEIRLIQSKAQADAEAEDRREERCAMRSSLLICSSIRGIIQIGAVVAAEWSFTLRLINRP